MALHLIQVTLGAGNTPITTTNTFARWVSIQNNAAHSVRVGDSSVSTTQGILLASGTPGGSVTMVIGPMPSTSIDLANIYLRGTSADVIDVAYLD